jgi:hypothetical protein
VTPISFFSFSFSYSPIMSQPSRNHRGGAGIGNENGNTNGSGRGNYHRTSSSGYVVLFCLILLFIRLPRRNKKIPPRSHETSAQFENSTTNELEKFLSERKGSFFVLAYLIIKSRLEIDRSNPRFKFFCFCL